MGTKRRHKIQWRMRADRRAGYRFKELKESIVDTVYLKEKELPVPASCCPSCAVTPSVMMAPPIFVTSGWGMPGVPLLAYIGEGQGIDETIGMSTAHCIIPIPHLSTDYVGRFRSGGPGFMCFSCAGYGRPLGLNGTLTGVTPRMWLSWLMKHGASGKPMGLPKIGTSKEHERLSLSSLLVEFYLGTYVELQAAEMEDAKLYNQAHAHLVSVTNQGAKRIVDYLFLACLGESRHLGRSNMSSSLPIIDDSKRGPDYEHARHLLASNKSNCEICAWFVKAISTKTGTSRKERTAVYQACPSPYTKAEVLAYLGQVFRVREFWSSGYGGPLWAMGSEVGGGYKEDNFSANYTLCDRIFNVTHNGGTIFSKNCGIMDLQASHMIMPILETKARAKHFGEYAWMSGLSSPPLFKMYKEVAKKLLKKGVCVLWDAEGRGGGGGTQ